MGVENNGIIISMKAYDVSIPAYRIMGVAAAKTVDIPNTTSSALIGVSTIDASATNQAVGVVISGSARCACGASVSVGATVGCQTSTGKCIEITSLLNTTTTVIPRSIGVALQTGSTNSVIEITVQPVNLQVVFA